MIKRLTVVGIASLVLFGIGMAFPNKADAHDTHKPPISSSYNSRIIDDSIFTNRSSMTLSEIQNFLNSKVPSCVSGFTCLKNYSQGGKSAARIIYETAQEFSINPQTILVTLQKEQSLVTDDRPDSTQYRTAMGYGCPEREDCNSDYYGFTNQVRLGTKLFRVGVDRNCGNNSSYPGWTVNSKWRLGNTTSVDGKSTKMGTCATGSLYNYTPHRPDSAWLTATNGSHYYGNYNFIDFFTDWFGTTRGSLYSSIDYLRCCHTSALPGSLININLKFKNNGQIAWYDETGVTSAPVNTRKVMLVTSNPIARSSIFATSDWGTYKNTPGRNFTAVYENNGTTLASDQHKADPGQVVEYSFQMRIYPNAKPGEHIEYFQPVLYGKPGEFNDPRSWIKITVNKPSYKSQVYKRCCHQEAFPGETVNAQMWFKNIGNVSWYDKEGAPLSLPHTPETMLYNARPLYSQNPLGGLWTGKTLAGPTFDAVYESDGATLASNQMRVQPGQIARYNFSFKVPPNAKPGDYVSWLQPAIPGQPTTFNDPGSWLKVTVKKPVYKATVHSRCCHQTASPGQTVAAQMWFKNAGNMTWYDKTGQNSAPAGTPEVMLYTARPMFNTAYLGDLWAANKLAGPNYTNVYESNGTTLASNQHRVLPGQIAKFVFNFKVPTGATDGDYITYLQPAIPGQPTTFNDPGSWLKVTVN